MPVQSNYKPGYMLSPNWKILRKLKERDNQGRCKYEIQCMVCGHVKISTTSSIYRIIQEQHKNCAKCRKAPAPKKKFRRRTTQAKYANYIQMTAQQGYAEAGVLNLELHNLFMGVKK